MKADSMSRKDVIRKANPLVLLAIVITLGALMSTTGVQAADLFQFKPQPQLANLADVMEESGFHVTSLGNSSAGLHVSMVPPAAVEVNHPASVDTVQGLKDMSEVYLSIRVPW
jgi:hypothetical protein